MYYFIKITKGNHSQYIRIHLSYSEVEKWITLLSATFPDYKFGAVVA